MTVAKAGIHATLNARCSVTAAANPLYGTYEPSMSITKNINLPDSLLSRFDVLFVLLDAKDPALDQQVADHVLRMHAYLPESSVHDDDREEGPVEAQSGEAMWARLDARTAAGNGGAQRVLTVGFLRKYLQYVKSRKAPELSDAACERISEVWAEMRQGAMRGTRDESALPVTARTLETLIRLSTAAAKIRQSAAVELEDVSAAEDILGHAGGRDGGDGAGGDGGAASPAPAPATPERESAPEEEEAGDARAGGAAGPAPAAAGPAAAVREAAVVMSTQGAAVPETEVQLPAAAAEGPGLDDEFGVPPAEGAAWTDVFMWEHRRGRDMTPREREELEAVLAARAMEYEADEEGRGIPIEGVVEETLERCGRPATLTGSAVHRALMAAHHSRRWMIEDDVIYPAFD